MSSPGPAPATRQDPPSVSGGGDGSARRIAELLDALLDELARRGVELSAEEGEDEGGGQLRFRAPKGALTPELRDALRTHKADLLRRLRREAKDAVLKPDPENRLRPFPLSPLQQAYLVGRPDPAATSPDPASPDAAGRGKDASRGTGGVTRSPLALAAVGPTSYNELELPLAPGSPVTPRRLDAAWRQLIDRHDMLRARVIPSGQLQVLAETPDGHLPVVDLRRLAPGQADGEAERIRRRLAHHGFRPDAWPLFRLVLSLLPAPARLRLCFSRDLLISDARTSENLLRELLALLQGHAPPPLTLSYRDYALAVERCRESGERRLAWAYWRSRLGSLPPAPELPLATPPASLTAYRFTSRDTRLAPELWTRLSRAAQRRGLTPSGLLCAAFAEVLAAWSRHPTFTLNLLFSRRLPLHPDVPRLVGNFASTVLLEVDAAGGSFEERARRLQERLWEDIRHASVSGVEVLRELQRRQAMGDGRARGGAGGISGGMPVVFSSVLGMDRAETRDQGSGPRGASSPEGPSPLDIRLVHSSVQTPQVYLELLVSTSGSGLFAALNAVEDLFPPGLLDALHAAYGALLRRLAGADLPDAHRVSHGSPWEGNPLLTPHADLELVREVNATAWSSTPDAPLDTRLHLLAAEGLRQGADRPAVLAPDRRLSHGELDWLAQGLAERILVAERTLAAEPSSRGAERLIAIVLPKGWRQVVAVCAVLRAGGAYLPIDPGLPGERIHHLLHRGEVRLAVTTPELATSLDWPEAVMPIALGVDDAEAGTGSGKRAETGKGAGTRDLAYVLFTSGSTGEPKGVMIEHRAAVNTVRDINHRFRIGPRDRVLALSALSFDLSVWDIFGLLGAGGALVLPPPGDAPDPEAWLRSLAEHQVTVWNTVPALAELLATAAESRGARLPACLRLVMLSGDWIPVTLPDRLRALSPREPAGETLEVISLGGATEASIWSVFYPIAATDPAWASIPYGRPLANQSLHVLDHRLRPRPVWVPGDLHIGGAGVARGYWRDGEKSAQSFYPHPETGEGLYRTGDVARLLPDGNLEFLGREDEQVKVQGFRIELGEIEAALLRHPAVREAVVAAVGERQGSKRLVAYVVPVPVPGAGAGPEDGLDVDSLLAALARRLPAYMVPHLFVRLAELPLTANGKVDRSRLPDPELAGASRRQAYLPPRDGVEARLVLLLEALLEQHPIGVLDDFFELGGNSLLALRLVAEIESVFGVRLPLAALLGGGSIEQLGQRLRDRGLPLHTPSPLVRLAGGGDVSPLVSPLVLVHPVGGNVLCYRELAHRLHRLNRLSSGPGGMPVYGLQSVFPGRHPGSVEGMAEIYLEALRESGCEGPYRLGGWSMGGVVAYEMAVRLRARGEDVDLLVLLDSEVPPGGELAMDESALLRRFVFDLTAASGREGLAPAAWDLGEEGDFASLWSRFRRWAGEAGLLSSGMGEAGLIESFQVFQANLTALERYRVPTSDLSVLLFPAAAERRPPRSADLGWSSKARGGVVVKPLPGDHYGLLRGEALTLVVREVEARLLGSVGFESKG